MCFFKRRKEKRAAEKSAKQAAGENPAVCASELPEVNHEVSAALSGAPVTEGAAAQDTPAMNETAPNAPVLSQPDAPAEEKTRFENGAGYTDEIPPEAAAFKPAKEPAGNKSAAVKKPVSAMKPDLMNLNLFVDKCYESYSLKELVAAPVDALQGLSAADAEFLYKAFHIKTVAQLAKLKFARWAQSIVDLAAGETNKGDSNMNIVNIVDKKYETMSLSELTNAPVDALQGLSAADAEGLKKAFNIKTVGDLAKNKFFRWAQAICILAQGEE